MKKLFKSAVMVGALLLLSMVMFNGCDLFESDGRIFITNASTYTIDTAVTARIRNTNLSTVGADASIARGTTMYWTLPPGSYDIRLVDGAGTVFIHPTTSFFSLGSGQDRRFIFTGTAIVPE